MSEGSGPSQNSRGIGTFARRIGRWVADVSDAVSFPESLRSAIDEAFKAQANGNEDQAARALLNLSVQRNIAALSMSAEVLLCLSRLDPMPAASPANETLSGALLELVAKGKSGALLEATSKLDAGQLDQALDLLRREASRDISLPPELSSVRQFVLALWGAHTDFAYGRFSRALLELDRIHAHLLAIVSHTRAPLCVDAAEIAVQSALHQGDLETLEDWATLLDRVLATQPGELQGPRLQAWQRAHDRAQALSLRLLLGRDPTRLQAEIAAAKLGEIHLRAEIAGAYQTPHDELPEDLALGPMPWRLLLARRLRRWSQNPSTLTYANFQSEFRRQQPAILNDLEQAAPDSIADLCCEFAFYALGAQFHGIDWDPWIKRINKVAQAVPATVQMAVTVAAIAQSQADPPLAATISMANSELAMGNQRGYDESSPLRWPSLRDPIFFGTLALLRGTKDQLAQRDSQAEHHFAHALAAWPYMTLAQSALDKMHTGVAAATLSEQLQALADQITPQSTEPVPVQQILRRCQHTLVAERERLGRPFTLAVMGEFSAGKSTFVNALIGREVAPMGVLPTTNTVNRFRHGKGTIRVHYENGKIQYIDAHESQKLLDDIDEDKAKTISFLDIEGDFEQLADLVIVDTPGLNATQAHHEQITRSFVEQADAVLWIFSATRAGASTESEIIKSLKAESRPILGLLNKTDTISQDEQDELLEYLHTQFGDQLLDIVPICASKALASRQGSPSEGQDHSSLRKIQSSLRAHLLDKSPEHKHAVAKNQSSSALKKAASELRAFVLGQEKAPSPDNPALQDGLSQDLMAIQETWLGLDAFLVRVALDLGIAASGRGRLTQLPSEQDRRYLHRRAKQRFFAQLDGRLSPQQNPSAQASIEWNAWARALRDWLDGYWTALAATDSLCEMLVLHADAAKQSERSYREEIRQALLESCPADLDPGHPLTVRMQGWLRASKAAKEDGQQDGQAYLTRVMLPRLLAASRSLEAASDPAP